MVNPKRIVRSYLMQKQAITTDYKPGAERSEKKLSNAHMFMHVFYDRKKVDPEWGREEGWSLEKIIEMHTKIVRAAKRLGMEMGIEHKTPLPPKKRPRKPKKKKGR